MLRNEGIAKASPMSGSMITATVMISVQSKYFRVDRVELPVLLIESFDNVIHRITSCTPAGRRIHPVSTEVSPPRKNMTAFVWARGAGSLSADRHPALRRHYSAVEQRDSKPRSP